METIGFQMNAPADTLKQQLVEALSHSDALRRSERADRIVWLSRYEQAPGIIAGRLEPLSLLKEARVCYIDGHYIAVLLTAAAFIEHTIVEELEEQAIVGPRDTRYDAISKARNANVFPTSLLDRTGQLRLIRNAFAHRKPDDHEHSLETRFRAHRIHPTSVLEQDAQEAIDLIYDYFRLTLKRA